MKISVGVSFLFFVSLALAGPLDDQEEIPDPHYGTREKCRLQFGFTEEDLFIGKNELDNMKCYLLCYLQDLGAMDDDGNFDPEIAVNSMKKNVRDVARAGIFKCHEKYQEFTDQCQHAYEIIKCFAQDSPDTYQLLGIFTPPQDPPQ